MKWVPDLHVLIEIVCTECALSQRHTEQFEINCYENMNTSATNSLAPMTIFKS